ncbi:MAG TPA: hypothetical protein PKW21_14690 [Rhabdaerophilum sp.]|nr:hypothetical protein [Rhabdaerophilum sp.]
MTIKPEIEPAIALSAREGSRDRKEVGAESDGPAGIALRYLRAYSVLDGQLPRDDTLHPAVTAWRHPYADAFSREEDRNSSRRGAGKGGG